MTEAELQDQIRVALAKAGHVFWRNNVGEAQYRGRRVRYGVGGPGGSDLIGIVGGRFCAIEIKTPKGKVSEEQERYLELVRKSGGIAGVVRSVEEALTLTGTSQ